MNEHQDVLNTYKKLDQRCLMYEIVIFISYLLILALSWFARNEGLALLGVLRVIRLFLVLGIVQLYITGVNCRKKLRKLRRCINYTYYLYGLEKL